MKIKKIKAAILVEQNKPLLVENIETPNKLKVGQILVKIFYTGICGSQIGEITGVKGHDKYLPHLLGHEASGEVIEIGDGVKKLVKGDRVILHWMKSEGINSETPEYKLKGRKINAGLVTTFNDYAIVSENRCTKIEKDIDLKIAALFGCAVTTGFGVIENKAKLKIGESIIIYGSGGVGLSIIKAASLSSAYPIIAVDIHEKRLKLAHAAGATHIFNGHSKNLNELLYEVNVGKKFDVFIDNTGQTEIIEFGYKITKQDGRIILVGVPKEKNNINIHSLQLHFGKVITGTHGGDGDPDTDIKRYITLNKNKNMNLKDMISEIINLDDINEYINDMILGKTAGRVLISFNN